MANLTCDVSVSRMRVVAGPLVGLLRGSGNVLVLAWQTSSEPTWTLKLAPIPSKESANVGAGEASAKLDKEKKVGYFDVCNEYHHVYLCLPCCCRPWGPSTAKKLCSTPLYNTTSMFLGYVLGFSSCM